MAVAVINNEQFYDQLHRLINSMNFGSMQTEVMAMLTNPANYNEITQAITELRYYIPSSTDATGTLKMKQLYWAVYYLKNFPLPELTSSNCSKIFETITRLAFEKANLAGAGLSSFDNVEVKQDIKIREQVLVDINTKYNALYAKLSCTKAEATQSSNVIPLAIGGVTILFGILILKKLLSKKKPV